jgi:hypothetical protein
MKPHVRIFTPLFLKCFTVLAGLLFAPCAFGGGTVANCTQADLEAAMLGGGKVEFACSGTLTLSKTITVSQDTFLDGTGQSVTLSGANNVRLLVVNTNVVFAARNLTLADGKVVVTNPSLPAQDANGAGILNLGGTVILNGCAITGCYVQGGPGGGPFTPGGHGQGAALCNFGGHVSLTNCTLVGNSASCGPGGSTLSFSAPAGGARGGAICSLGGSVELESSKLLTNASLVATSLAGTGSGREGQNLGGAIYASNASVYVEDSVLAGNMAIGAIGQDYSAYASEGGLASGGALFIDQAADLTVLRSRFEGNAVIGAEGAHLDSGGAARGGAIFCVGKTDVRESTFAGNTATGGACARPPMASAGLAQGGAVFSDGSLVLNACTFHTNRTKSGDALGGTIPASEGGAIWCSGTTAVTNSTITANRSHGFESYFWGTGPAHGGGIAVADGTATLVNLTIAANATAFSGIDFQERSLGGGLYCAAGKVTLLHSIIANNTEGGDVWGTLTDAGYNLCSDATAGFSATGSLNNTDPLLGPLADNGGPTLTMLPMPASPARDAIPAGFPVTDQRGVSRPQGALADIGAVEAESGLTLIPSRSGKDLVITFTAQPGTYRLLCTTNLITWSAVATNHVPAAGPAQFIAPTTLLQECLFRVVTP